MLVLGTLLDLHRTDQHQLLGVCGWGIDLNYCDIDWFALETNHDLSATFEVVPKYCILDYFVDYEVTPFLLWDSYPQIYTIVPIR